MMGRCLEIYNLVIETTRRCNMHCAHCLRGNAECKDMHKTEIFPLLDRVNHIGTITFSGGEPSLNVEIMNDVLEYVKANDIPVDAFYIVTNGKVVTDEFLCVIIKWYAYCMMNYGEEDICGLCLSTDEFHEKIPAINKMKLKAFSFYREDKNINYKDAALVPMGRALTDVDHNAYRFIDKHTNNILVEKYDDTLYVDGEIYVSVNGDICTDCDMDYNTIANESIGNIADMDDFVRYCENKVMKGE